MARSGTLFLALTLVGCADGVPDRALPDASAPDTGVGPSPEIDVACYDGADNDLDGASDCGDDACVLSALCCVGSGALTCCASTPTTVSLSAEACSDGDASTCFGDPVLSFFGEQTPTIEDGGLVPQGGAGEGGVSLGPAVDPRAVDIAIEADIEAPANRCSDCVDAAGIAVLESLPTSGQLVSLPIGLLVSGARSEVLVLVAGEVVTRTSIPDGIAHYRIDLDVSGNASVTMNGTTIASFTGIALPSQAWLVVFGRTANRSAGVPSVRVRSATASTFACDAPAALARTSTPIVPWSGSTWTPSSVRRPSVVAWDEDTTRRVLMAFEHEGQIYLAERTGFGEFRNGSGDPGPPAFTMPAELISARDPWLVIDRARFVLFFVGVEASGRTSIWRVTGDPTYAQTFSGTPASIVSPESIGAVAIDGPAVFIEGTSWTLVARAHVDAEHHRIVELLAEDGADWTLRGGSLDAATIRAPSDDLFAFDRDEVATPALVVDAEGGGNAIRRLYYAGRRGTRWSIGLLVSRPEEPTVWRALGPVLEPGTGYDALGVADPAPLVEDGTLRLYYAGTPNGAQWSIGASGPAGTIGE